MSSSFAIPWILAHQAPLTMGFPRQEYWSGLLVPSTGDLADPGIEPGSPELVGWSFTTEPPEKPLSNSTHPKTRIIFYTMFCALHFFFFLYHIYVFTEGHISPPAQDPPHHPPSLFPESANSAPLNSRLCDDCSAFLSGCS